MNSHSALSLLLVCISFLTLPSLVAADVPKKGEQAPTFKVKTIDGKEVSFYTDYKGKLVMLDFWATWCGPCMAEVPGLVKGYREYHPKGLEVLGFSVDKPDAVETVKKVMAEKHMTWDMCLSKAEMGGAIPKMYGIIWIPSAFLVDGDTGKIIAGAGGALRGDNLPRTLAAAFKEKAAADHKSSLPRRPEQLLFDKYVGDLTRKWHATIDDRCGPPDWVERIDGQGR